MAKQKEEMEVVQTKTTQLINCLENRVVNVRSIFKETDMVKDKGHYLAYPVAEPCTRTYVAPQLSSGQIVNVLTDSEKAYLEHELGRNLSVYAKDEENVWMNTRVRLKRGDNFFNLADPWDFIKYKILLANKQEIAKSLQELEEHPKATYRFVVVNDDIEKKFKLKKLNSKQRAYFLLGELKQSREKLVYIYETMSGRPVSQKMTADDILADLDEYIVNDAAKFVAIASDEQLYVKTLIKRCVTARLIVMKGDYYYLAEDNSPLCDENQNPTFDMVANYISSPKRAELKLSLEKKLEVSNL